MALEFGMFALGAAAYATYVVKNSEDHSLLEPKMPAFEVGFGIAGLRSLRQVSPSHIQFFFEAADRMAGSPNDTHCATSASTQMYHGIGS
jgi:hypothetical protein